MTLSYSLGLTTGSAIAYLLDQMLIVSHDHDVSNSTLGIVTTATPLVAKTTDIAIYLLSTANESAIL